MTTRQRIKQRKRQEIILCLCGTVFATTVAALLVMGALI